MARYVYTQESGTDFKVNNSDKADALEDTNQVRQILDDIGELLGHSKFDDLYPADGTAGGDIDIRRVTTKTGAATLTTAEAGFVKVSAAAGYTLTLPTAVGNKLTYIFVKTDDNANLITIDGNASETINGALTYTDLNYQYAYVILKSDNANWVITGRSRIIVRNIHFQDLRAADDDYVHAAITGTGVEQEINTAITNPDVSRNVSVKTTNVAAPSGDVKITGVNDKGVSAEENITIVAGSTAYGNVAWATISKITVPAGVSASDTVTIGTSDKLGLGIDIINTGDVFKKKVNNEDKSSEISGNVDTTYDTLDCATIVANEETTIWFKGRV